MTPDDDLPRFVVPGQESATASLEALLRLHHGGAVTDCTLWDPWLPHATLWTAGRARDAYRAIFRRRRIDHEGYVSMQQHRGMAHGEGWPFPAWQQSGGMGWHFSTEGDVWAIQVFGLQPLARADGWEVEGARSEGFDPARGWTLRATADRVVLTTPAFACPAEVAPFVRLEWDPQGLAPDSRPAISWQRQGERGWDPARTVPLPPSPAGDGMRAANVPVHRHPDHGGTLVRLRLVVDRAAGARMTVKSLFTAIDTRHPITGPNHIRGAAETFAWTGDTDFLRDVLPGMRRALRFTLSEFDVERRGGVRVPWVGHDGRSGLSVAADGRKTLHPGRGVGNNYWDLLPFGGDDALATVYLYDALRRMAALERAASRHPEWRLPSAPAPFDPRRLERLAERVRRTAGRRFWDPKAGRFCGWRDLSGRAYDYGFTFVNLEAIHYGLATPDQARRILEWLDGEREIPGDTSRGADIYRWRFAPRATTRRNVDTYVWAWSAPESIPWGGQVQDGGAVLGFSYFDVMARLATRGPDDAWKRLRAICDWRREVEAEGGYRAYYAKPGRGTLQGGGTAGGLGLDVEFLESVLVPAAMLHGFLGVRPEPGGVLRIAPRLPRDWPSLTVTRVHFHGHVLDIEATRTHVAIAVRATDGAPLVVAVGEDGAPRALRPVAGQRLPPIPLPRRREGAGPAGGKEDV